MIYNYDLKKLILILWPMKFIVLTNWNKVVCSQTLVRQLHWSKAHEYPRDLHCKRNQFCMLMYAIVKRQGMLKLFMNSIIGLNAITCTLYPLPKGPQFHWASWDSELHVFVHYVLFPKCDWPILILCMNAESLAAAI